MKRPGNYIGITTDTDYTQKRPYGNKGVWSLRDQYESKSKKEWVSLTPRTDTSAQYLQVALPFNYYVGLEDMSSYIKQYFGITPAGSPATINRYSDWGGGLTLDQSAMSLGANYSAFPVNYGSSAGLPVVKPLNLTTRYNGFGITTGTAIGTGPYCFEAWVYLENFTFGQKYSLELFYPGVKDTNNSAQNVPYITIKGDYWPGSYPRGLWLGYPIYPYNQGFLTETGAYTISAGTWTHIAVTRDSSYTVRLFINGSYLQATSDSRSYGNEYNLCPTNCSYDGEVRFQDVRIYVGTPKYTNSFTPPASMFLQD